MSDEERLAEAYGIAAEAQRRAAQAEADLKQRQREAIKNLDQKFEDAKQDAVDTFMRIRAGYDNADFDG